MGIGTKTVYKWIAENRLQFFSTKLSAKDFSTCRRIKPDNVKMDETHLFLDDLPAMKSPETPRSDNPSLTMHDSRYLHDRIDDHHYQEAYQSQVGGERIQVMLDSTLIGIRDQLADTLYNLRHDIEMQVRAEQVQSEQLFNAREPNDHESNAAHLNNERQELDHQIEVLRAQINQMREECESREHFRSELDEELNQAQEKRQILVEERADLKGQLSKLKDECWNYERIMEGRVKEYQALHERYGAFTGKHANIISDLEAAEQQRKKFQDQIAKYRDIIRKNPNASGTEPEDATIIKAFSNLREGAQRVIMKFCTLDQPPRNVAPPTHRQFSSPNFWNEHLNSREIQNRVRAGMFWYLKNSLLLVRSFGLEGLEKISGIRGRTIEKGLRDFEEKIELAASDPQDSADIATWRTATLKCAKLLHAKASSDHADYVAEMANELNSFLAPIRIQYEDVNIDLREQQKLKEHLMQLCRDSHNLTLLLRGCRNTYRCEIPEQGELMNPEEAEAQDKERRQPPCGGTEGEQIVAYTLFGGLVRIPEGNPKNRVVLQKSWVVLRCD
ncbi:hypothetical protein BHYA_0099g00060 [Botrytis hyacinthi]|uniref:Uncharacterized protein n=1 Tax=Botrytis hyacinthi TaxID=278943 RepID=A0A4Z1GVD5_9HELO|nr:hypothetical protein BHYA_0099g00060 [Botrytis hyacinthi]